MVLQSFCGLCSLSYTHKNIKALVAQLDRALGYELRGRGFESSPARHFFYN